MPKASVSQESVMQATALFSPARDGFSRSQSQSARRFAQAHAAAPSTVAIDEMQAHYRRALQDAVGRAERAERLLRARLIDLTWPAVLSSMAGGFMAIVGLRLAGW